MNLDNRPIIYLDLDKITLINASGINYIVYPRLQSIYNIISSSYNFNELKQMSKKKEDNTEI